jgi:hypothetical protein
MLSFVTGSESMIWTEYKISSDCCLEVDRQA